jgi:hypothetical protein
VAWGEDPGAMMFLRGFLAWCAIIPLAIVNGILRDAVLVKVLPAAAARFCSGVILSAVIVGWTLFTMPWIRAAPLWRAAVLGACWLVLTVLFEFAFGRLVAGRAWDELLRPYRFEGGDIWPVVLVVVAAAPLIAALVRGPE